MLEEARTLAGMGYTEIQLLGQNVNSWRDPSDPSRAFSSLLEEVARVPGIRRVRFTTSHPRDFGRDIVEVIDRNETICNMVHLPVQSGSTRVLERMRRQYTREEYMQRIEWLKNARRRISLSTDIIVGFPGETEAGLRADAAAAGRGRIRPGVQFQVLAAAEHPCPPSGRTGARGREIAPADDPSGEAAGIQLRRNSAQIGTVQEVLVEGYNSSTGQWIGRTTENRVLNFITRPRPDGSQPSREEMFGRYLPVRVTRAGPNSLAGECAIAV